MFGWLYLIRNRDLYKIGITKNLENRMRQLKPDNIVAKLYTRDYINLEKELHSRYRKYRIPQTEYFRLENHHIKEIQQRISLVEFPRILVLSIFNKTFFKLLIITFFLFIIFSLSNNEINIIIFKLVVWMEKLSIFFSII